MDKYGDKNRDKDYTRKQNFRMIRKRMEMIKDEYRSLCNLKSIITDIIPGKLGKGHDGHLGDAGCSKKTKAKHGHASYRHKGAYGKAIDYKRHDMQQMIDQDQQLKEYNKEEEYKTYEQYE